MSETRILHSKINPPRQMPFLLRRPNLARKLRFMLTHPFSLIHAGVGYGKSTAIAAFLADEQILSCWYNIAEEDGDLRVFVRHIVESVRSRHATFGESLLTSLQHLSGLPSPDDVEQLISQFIHELMCLPDQVLLIIDNYHCVQKSFFIDQWMQLFVRNLPNNVKLVMLARYQPLWPWLALMRARGEYGEIGQQDLAFNMEDVEALYIDEYGLAITSVQMDEILRVTCGWVMALRSIGERLTKGQAFTDAIVSQESLFRLLESEVFARQEHRIRHFLLFTAVFEEFSLDHCAHLLISGSATILEEVLRRNLVIVKSDGSYRYHPLFRHLLLNKLANETGLFTVLHQSAADYLYLHGKEEEAFDHLKRIGNWKLIGERLADIAERLLTTGQLEQLYKWMKQLPKEVKHDYHTLWFYQGEVERCRCLYPQAFASYQQFLKQCVERNDVIGRCRGLEGQARVYLDSVQGLKAEVLLKQAISLIDPHDRAIAPRLYRLLSEIYTNRGDATAAGEWYRRSQELEQQTEVELESRLLFRTGRLQSAIHLLESKWAAEFEEMPHLTRSYRETSLLLSFVYGLNGEWEKGISAADTAIRQGSRAHSPFVEACGYVRKAHAALMSSEFSADQIRLLYLKGLRMMEELQSTRGKAEALLGLTLLHGREKELDIALAYGKRGLQETETIKDDWVNSLIRLGMGIAYAHADNDEQAKSVFVDCVNQLGRCGDGYGVAISYLWLSFLAYKQKSWESFVPAVTQAICAIQAGDYSFLLHRPTMFTPNDVQSLMPILIEAQHRQVYPDYVSQLLTELGLQNVSFHPGYTLRIQTLGQFRIWLGDRELNEKAWKRGKAKQLFQLLLTKRQHLMGREEILAYLWTENEEEVANRDFKVALNALNKALEPNREPRASSYFIQRHGTNYGLNLASGYHVDSEAFEKLVTLGLTETKPQQTIVLLEKGLAYYQGEYLPDCRYEDWCMEEREQLNVLFLRGAEKLAQVYEALQQYDEAIRWCEAIVKVDDCWEEAYRLLMKSYYRKNNRSQAIRWYDKCVAKLQEQFGVTPLPVTEQTYRMIIDVEL